MTFEQLSHGVKSFGHDIAPVLDEARNISQEVNVGSVSRGKG